MRAVPVYTVMTAQQASKWIQPLLEPAMAFVAEAKKAGLKPADAAMIHVLAAMACCEAGGFKVREFVALVEDLRESGHSGSDSGPTPPVGDGPSE